MNECSWPSQSDYKEEMTQVKSLLVLYNPTCLVNRHKSLLRIIGFSPKFQGACHIFFFSMNVGRLIQWIGSEEELSLDVDLRSFSSIPFVLSQGPHLVLPFQAFIQLHSSQHHRLRQVNSQGDYCSHALELHNPMSVFSVVTKDIWHILVIQIIPGDVFHGTRAYGYGVLVLANEACRIWFGALSCSH